MHYEEFEKRLIYDSSETGQGEGCCLASFRLL